MSSKPRASGKSDGLNLPAMPNCNTLNIRDSALIAVTSIFGISYFSLFVLQFLFFHFPSSQSEIINALAIIVFGAGVIVWCLSGLIGRIICVCHGDEAANWQRFELSAFLFLIWTTALPTIIILFPAQPFIQLGYLSVFTIITVGKVVDFLFCEPGAGALHVYFLYHCASLVLLSLVPAIHALIGTVHTPPPLAAEFGRMVISNVLGAAFFLLQPLERMGLVHGWRPSLHAMQLVLAHSIITYSSAVLQATLTGRP